MIAFKCYEPPQKMPSKLKIEKGDCCCLIISQVKNGLPCILFKKTSYSAKRSDLNCVKKYNSIKFCLYWGK